MKDSYLSASDDVFFDLDQAELEAVAAYGLLDSIIEPAFSCHTCNSILESYAQETEGDYDKAAREWMEEYFDVLCSAVYACRQLVGECSDRLQMLPFQRFAYKKKQKE